VEFNIVSFDGAGPASTALLGGHIDVLATGISSMMPMQKSGQVRFLGFFADDGKKVLPDVPTMAAAGYKGFDAFGLYRGFFVPAGTPPEVVSVLDKAMKTSIENGEQSKRMADVGQVVTYKNSAEFSAFWDQMESSIKPLVEEVLKTK
jgi:tripartite-type tricarboxylate transporter receptor subunit TctC